MRPVRLRRAAVVAAGLAALAVTAAAEAQAPAEPGAPGTDAAAEARSAALDAAAAWRGVLESHRAPQLPTPGDSESVILMLDGPAAVASDPGDRAAAAAAVTADQDELVPVLSSLGATVTFRYRVLVNGIGVRLPAGRLEALAALPEVTAVIPVGFLAPAQAGAPTAPETPIGVDPSAPIGVDPSPPNGTAPEHRQAAAGPAHVALIDAGVDASHPWLGGGMGPTFPVIGGADLIDGDDDPAPDPADPAGEAHGTQMASIVMRSPALSGLAPADQPRLLAYRVVAREPVGGRLRPLARTDRVLAALERAVDPDRDGDTSDAAQVILLGLAAGFEGGGIDPLASALAATDRAGSTVVAPAGNDGPTFSRPGSVGGPAAGRTVIAVGGASAATGPRTAHLDARLGPASARLGSLPLMGAAPTGAAMPVVLLRDDAGVSQGGAPEDFRGPDDVSRVAGALVVVSRGDAPLAETAARAADAGATAVAVWDEDGSGSFPAVPGDSGLRLPVVGLGPAQGAALADLVAGTPDIRVSLAADPVTSAPATVASFSSWGPTIDGRQKPDLVAPAVDRPAAWPGRGPDGGPQTVSLTGTSAAAAEVAAIALRLRVDRPELGPRAVHSLLVQSARPLEGVAAARQGAGLAALPAGPAALRFEPPIVAADPGRDGARATVTLGDLAGGGGPYSVLLEGGGSEEVVAAAVQLAPGGRAQLRLDLPRAAGWLVVRDDEGATVGRAPVVARRAAGAVPDALGTPEVRADASLAEVRVRLGLLRRDDGRLHAAQVSDVALALVPVGGGDPLPVAGAGQRGSWPAGSYRFLVARRLASGLDAPAGRYRLRVTARGPDGTSLRTRSAPFTLR